MNLPVTPVFEGDHPEFLRRMTPLVGALPDIFDRLRQLKLERCYRSLRKFRFVEHLERGANVISFYDPSADALSIYPLAFTVGTRIDLATYSGLGLRFWHLAVPVTARVLWARLLIKPDRALIDRLAQEIEEGGHSSWHDVLARFHTALDRLQVIHVLNALIHNNLTVQQAETMSIYDYPPTRDFCASLRPFSLAPLLSAYAGLDDLRQYQYAFAQYCSHQGKLPVSETSTEAALVELFELVTLHPDQVK